MINTGKNKFNILANKLLTTSNIMDYNKDDLSDGHFFSLDGLIYWTINDGRGCNMIHQVGAKIRKYRSNMGWSIRDLEARSNVSKSLIADIERGKANPTYQTLEKLAACFGLTVEALFDEDEHAATTDTGTGG